MRRLVPFAVALGLLVTPAAAQYFPHEGNWECRAGDVPAGLLAMFGNGYIYTSNLFGDPGSGGGTVESYTDGAMFADGNMRAAYGVQIARLVTMENGSLGLQLETADAVAMVCTRRASF